MPLVTEGLEKKPSNRQFALSAAAASLNSFLAYSPTGSQTFISKTGFFVKSKSPQKSKKWRKGKQSHYKSRSSGPLPTKWQKVIEGSSSARFYSRYKTRRYSIHVIHVPSFFSPSIHTLYIHSTSSKVLFPGHPQKSTWPTSSSCLFNFNRPRCMLNDTSPSSNFSYERVHPPVNPAFCLFVQPRTCSPCNVPPCNYYI